MSPEQALLSFALAAGVLTVTPGLDTALVLRTAAVEGRKSGMLAGCGICFGCLLWGVAASLGLSAVIAVSHFAFDVLRIIGACYLAYLGIALFVRALSSRPSGKITDPSSSQHPPSSGFHWLRRGLLTNLLNPKIGVFYLTFLPQFIPNGVNVWSFSLVLALVHATEGIAWFLLLTNATESLSRWLRRRRVVIALDGAMGAILIAFGLKLALEKAR